MAAGRYHWSHCASPARFFKINAVASLPWLAVVLYPRWSTLIFAVVVSSALVYVEVIHRMTLRAFLRAVNVIFTGRVKSTQNLMKELSK